MKTQIYFLPLIDLYRTVPCELQAQSTSKVKKEDFLQAKLNKKYNNFQQTD
tara:strand:+ start:8784 stop:8936 length:153 start_codon:yes stop_codon:yes gene_type:complete